MANDDAVSGEDFEQAVGSSGWTVHNAVGVATFATGSFARGVELVVEVGRLADAMDHHPDVDLRYPSVTVRVSSHDIGGLSRRDIALAEQVSAAATSLGISTG